MAENDTRNLNTELEPWAMDVRLSFKDYLVANSRSKGELGVSSSGNSGKINEKCLDEMTERFAKVREEIGEKMPEFVLLHKSNGNNLTVRTNIGPLVFGGGPTIYYLPRTDEYYSLREDMATIPENCYPESDGFLGFESARTNWNQGVIIRKVGNYPSDRLSEEDIGKVLQTSESSLKSDSEDLKVIHDALDDIGKISEARDRQYEEKTQQHAANLKTRINNLSSTIIFHLGKHSVPKRIKVPASWLPDEDGGKDRYYLPHEGKIITVPLNKKKVWGRIREVPDFSKAIESENRDWLRTGLLAIELLSSVPPDVRKAIKSTLG